MRRWGSISGGQATVLLLLGLLFWHGAHSTEPLTSPAADHAAAQAAPGAKAVDPIERAMAMMRQNRQQGQQPLPKLLQVHLNGNNIGQTGLFLAVSGQLYASKKSIESWRLRPPHQPGIVYQGRSFYPLSDIAGLEYRVNRREQTIELVVEANRFDGTVVGDLVPVGPSPDPISPGGFFNYDLFWHRVDAEDLYSGLFEVGVFSNWGTLGSRFAYRHDFRGDQWMRLDTNWRYDNPGNMTTLVLGDSITHTSRVGVPVRIGGVTFGTNFATQPYFVSFPMPSLGGSAALPSALDLYVNGVLRSNENVPQGPFSIPDVPVTTGPGTAKLVVTDVLGRQQVITTSFYANSQLLNPGLTDYSISLGSLRFDYGSPDSNYDGWAMTGLARHGFTDYFTGEVYAEAGQDLGMVSLGGVFSSRYLGAASLTVAASHSPLGDGMMGALSLSRQWRRYQLSLNAAFADTDFTSLGRNGLPPPKRELSLSVSANPLPGVSLRASYLDRTSTFFGRRQLVTAGFSTRIGDHAFLSVNGFYTLNDSHDGAVMLSLSMPFGDRTSASAHATYENGETTGYVQLQRSLPVGVGYGYRLSSEIGQDPTSRAEFSYRGPVGTYRIGAAHTSGLDQFSAEARGGLVFIGGGVHATRQIDQAFGLVKVAGLEGIPVYRYNQQVAVTDADGEAIIPNMQSYQHNRLRIGLQNLPIDTQLQTLKMDVVPRYRSGVVANFPVTHTRSATLTVQLADGSWLPSGASVYVNGGTRNYPVGLDGRVYVTQLQDNNMLRAEWDNQRCAFRFAGPGHGDGPVPDLGTFTCLGANS